MLNPSNKAYVIKFANGEAQLMTAEHAQTHDGIAALAFAKEAGEEVLFLDTDDAVDLIMDICHNKKTAALN